MFIGSFITMSDSAKAFAHQQGKIITITRIIAAPRAKVFQAWIEPRHIVHWYHATEGWSTPFAESDPRKGGALRIGFQSPDRKNDFVLEGKYDEVEAPRSLAFTMADGRPVRVTLTERDGKTQLALDLTLETTYSEEQQRQGWSAMVDNLARYLDGT
jgi:uncharacterized protein YndB with AHSA1/START domain